MCQHRPVAELCGKRQIHLRHQRSLLTRTRHRNRVASGKLTLPSTCCCAPEGAPQSVEDRREAAIPWAYKQEAQVPAKQNQHHLEWHSKHGTASKTVVNTQPAFTDEEGRYHGSSEVVDAWRPIACKIKGPPLKEREPLKEAECREFGLLILDLLEEHPSWGGSMVATALHRLTRMRVYHGHFVPPCKQAFEILLGKIVEASCSQTPRDIATVLWSIAKISNVESLHIRRQGQVEAGSEGGESPERPVNQTLSPETSAALDSWDSTDRAEALVESSMTSSTDSVDSSSGSVSFDQLDGTELWDRPHRARKAKRAKLKAKPDRVDAVERRPSTKEYFLPQRGRKSHREQPNVAAVDALVDQLKKGVVEAPQSFYSDLDAIAAQWDSKREELHTPQSVALVLWSMATLGYIPLRGSTLGAARERLLRLCSQLTSIDVSNAFWSHLKLREEIPPELLHRLTERLCILMETKELQIVAIPGILQAYVELNLHGVDQVTKKALDYIFGQSSKQPITKLTSGPLTQLFTAVAASGRKFPPRYAHRWAHQVLYTLEEFSLADLAAIVIACRRMDIDPIGGHFLRRLYSTHPPLHQVRKALRGKSKTSVPLDLKRPPKIVAH